MSGQQGNKGTGSKAPGVDMSSAPPPSSATTGAPPPSSAATGAPPPSSAATGAPPPSSAATSAPPPSSATTGAPPPSSAATGAPPPSSATTGAPPPSSAATGAPPPSSATTGAPPPSSATTGAPPPSSAATGAPPPSSAATGAPPPSSATTRTPPAAPPSPAATSIPLATPTSSAATRTPPAAPPSPAATGIPLAAPPSSAATRTPPAAPPSPAATRTPPAAPPSPAATGIPLAAPPSSAATEGGDELTNGEAEEEDDAEFIDHEVPEEGEELDATQQQQRNEFEIQPRGRQNSNRNVNFFTPGNNASIQALTNIFSQAAGYTHTAARDGSHHKFTRNIAPDNQVEVTVHPDRIQTSANAEQQDFDRILDLIRTKSVAAGLDAASTEITGRFANPAAQTAFLAALEAKRTGPEGNYWRAIKVIDGEGTRIDNQTAAPPFGGQRGRVLAPPQPDPALQLRQRGPEATAPTPRPGATRTQ